MDKLPYKVGDRYNGIPTPGWESYKNLIVKCTSFRDSNRFALYDEKGQEVWWLASIFENGITHIEKNTLKYFIKIIEEPKIEKEEDYYKWLSDRNRI